MKTVTLDALIPREDLDIVSDAGSSNNTRACLKNKDCTKAEKEVS